MPPGEDEPQRHIVIFDCNVYLDVACFTGPPFSWNKFDAEVARLAGVEVPHPTNRVYDSMRAIGVCTSGLFASNETLEVWTSAHIDKIVQGKSQQSVVPNASGYRGLGWSKSDAQALVDDLIYGIIDMSDGGSLDHHYPEGNPPLDHEDGMVYGACRVLAGEDPLAKVYCVTNDKGFLKAAKEQALGSYGHVLTPSLFVKLVRSARAQYSIGRMPPPAKS